MTTCDSEQQRNLRRQLESINQLLAQIYGKPTRLSGILTKLGLSEEEILSLKIRHAALLAHVAVDAVRTRFEALRSGERDFVILSARLGLRGTPSNLAVIGHELGISRQRVRQLELRVQWRCRRKEMRQVLEEALATAVHDLVVDESG